MLRALSPIFSKVTFSIFIELPEISTPSASLPDAPQFWKDVSSIVLLEKSESKASAVELKYDKDNDEQVNIVTSHLPFRVSKVSKYVEGVKRLGIC